MQLYSTAHAAIVRDPTQSPSFIFHGDKIDIILFSSPLFAVNPRHPLPLNRLGAFRLHFLLNFSSVFLYSWQRKEAETLHKKNWIGAKKFSFRPSMWLLQVSLFLTESFVQNWKSFTKINWHLAHSYLSSSWIENFFVEYLSRKNMWKHCEANAAFVDFLFIIWKLNFVSSGSQYLYSIAITQKVEYGNLCDAKILICLFIFVSNLQYLCNFHWQSFLYAAMWDHRIIGIFIKLNFPIIAVPD